MRSLCASALAVFLAGCAGTAPTVRAPAPPAPAPPTAQTTREPPPAPRGVPPAPQLCDAFAQRSATTTPSCAEPAAARGALLDALRQSDAADRDARLRGLEACAGLPTGVARALRAELAPIECGDALIEPYVASPPANLRADIRDALAGLSLAARAHRLVRTPPKLDPPHDKDRVSKFVKTTLAEWIGDQAHAVHEIGVQGAALSGYGRGVVAIEAGLADLRFVEVARTAPIPDDIAKDTELAEAYYATLDEALEPRKARGRDAALVGLGALASVGVLKDRRVDRARALLSKLYSGRRIDALDSLLLPAVAEAKPETPDQKLAAELPTFYAEVLLAELDPRDAKNLGALLKRGLPAFARARLSRETKNVPSENLFARGLFDLGRSYWLAADFTAATAAATRAPKNTESLLIAALAKPLAAGPKNAAEMMLRGPHLPKGVADVKELDRLARSAPAAAPFASYDAARLLEIAPPSTADATYWQDVAKRFSSAEKLWASASGVPEAERSERRELARAGARAAEETARAIEGKN